MTNSARVEERQIFDDGKLRSCSIIGRPFSRTSVAYKKKQKNRLSQSVTADERQGRIYASQSHTHTHTHNHSTKKQTKKQRNKCSWWTDGRTRQQTKQQTCFDLSVLLSAFCGKTKYPPGKLRGWSKEPRTVTVAFTVALSVGETEDRSRPIDRPTKQLSCCHAWLVTAKTWSTT